MQGYYLFIKCWQSSKKCKFIDHIPFFDNDNRFKKLQCNFVRRQQQITTALYAGVNERPEDKQLPGLIVILSLLRDRPIEYL